MVTDEKDFEKHRRNPFFRHDDEVYDENNNLACYMVKMDRKKIKDSKPVHMGVAILQWSKVLFVRYVYPYVIWSIYGPYVIWLYFQFHVLVGRTSRRRSIQDLLRRYR